MFYWLFYLHFVLVYIVNLKSHDAMRLKKFYLKQLFNHYKTVSKNNL